MRFFKNEKYFKNKYLFIDFFISNYHNRTLIFNQVAVSSFLNSTCASCQIHLSTLNHRKQPRSSKNGRRAGFRLKKRSNGSAKPAFTSLSFTIRWRRFFFKIWDGRGKKKCFLRKTGSLKTIWKWRPKGRFFTIWSKTISVSLRNWPWLTWNDLKTWGSSKLNGPF